MRPRGAAQGLYAVPRFLAVAKEEASIVDAGGGLDKPELIEFGVLSRHLFLAQKDGRATPGFIPVFVRIEIE